MLIDDIGAALSARFSPIYKDALLRRPTIVDNGSGGTSAGSINDVPCKVQVDALTQTQREAGHTESDVRLIILIEGLDRRLPDDGRVLDDDEVRVLGFGGKTYRIAGPALDPAGSHWTCRGRVKP